MFSQQTIKKMHMGMPLQNTQYNYHPVMNLNNQPDYNSCYGNDNFSCYSNSTTATSNNRKRNLSEEFNSILSACMEELLPKIAEGCAELVYADLSKKIDNQGNEIQILQKQLERLYSKNNTSHLNKHSTPFKKLQKLQQNLNQINNEVSHQNKILKEHCENSQNLKNESNFLTNFEEKLKSLQGVIEEERFMAESINNKLKDRHVDFMGIKHFVDEKFGYMINDIRHFPCDENKKNENYYHIINTINTLADEITNKSNINKKYYSNLYIESFGTKEDEFIKSQQVDREFENNLKPQNNINKSEKEIPAVSNTSHTFRNNGNSRKTITNTKFKKFSF